MKYAIVLFLVVMHGCSTESESSSTVKDIEDIRTMSICPDGRFDVICQNGDIELRSAEDLRDGFVCNGGGGGGGSGYICIARDNDGRASWIIGSISGGVQRYSNVVFSEIEQCQAALVKRIDLPSLTYVCGSSDCDGRDPWTVYALGQSATAISGIKYGSVEQCYRATMVAGGSNGNVVICSSRDNDGRDPWSIFSIVGTQATRTSTSYGTFEACESAMGSGTDGILCAARDNDGRAPWIVSDISAGEPRRYTDAVYATIEQCEQATRSSLFLDRNTQLVCVSKDRDGRDPWSVVKLTGSGEILTSLIYATIDQCVAATRSAVVRRGSASLCASRDADGRNPWNIFTINAGGVSRTDFSYGDFEACRGSLGNN